jgi:hypothetical protein
MMLGVDTELGKRLPEVEDEAHGVVLRGFRLESLDEEVRGVEAHLLGALARSEVAWSSGATAR